MSLTPEALSARLQQEAEKTLDFFSGLAPDEWSQQIYASESGPAWSLEHILIHFVTAEQAFQELIRDVLAGGRGAPLDFDIDRFNAGAVAGMPPIAQTELLALFARVRQESARLVSDLKLSDLERPGRHPFLGETTLLEIIKMIYRHNQIHLREVRRVSG